MELEKYQALSLMMKNGCIPFCGCFIPLSMYERHILKPLEPNKPVEENLQRVTKEVSDEIIQ